jgi:hypothetical protein
MNVLMALLTEVSPAPKPIDKSKVEPGWIALVFLVVLGGAVALLWFSMRKQMNRIDVGRHQRERAARSSQQAVPTQPPMPTPPVAGPPPPTPPPVPGPGS